MRGRRLGWGAMVVGLALLGCSAEGQLQAKVGGAEKPPEPPKPVEPPKPADKDEDGVTDDVDKCLDEKEDKLPPDDKDGCKSTDPDGDKILGDADKCPNEPETVNEYKDDDGCPDKTPRVMVVKNEVRINDKILFKLGKATIEKESEDLLKNIADVVKENAQIDFLEIAGHADKQGDEKKNQKLTAERAQAVLDALAKLGIEKKRMRAAGYGQYCPIDPGDNEAAFEKNRRVEFKIMRLEGKDTGVALGCPEAEKKGIKPAGVPATAPKSQPKAEAAKSAEPTKKDEAVKAVDAGKAGKKDEGLAKPEVKADEKKDEKKGDKKDAKKDDKKDVKAETKGEAKPADVKPETKPSDATKPASTK